MSDPFLFHEAIKKAKKKLSLIVFVLVLLILIPTLSYYFNNTEFSKGYIRYDNTENLGKVINWMLVDNNFVEDINHLKYFPTSSEVVFESKGELLIWGEAREIIIKSFDDEELN